MNGVVRRYEYAAALLLELVGSAGALLVAARTWQTVTTPRPAPLPADVLRLSGRTVDAAPTALALVALAGAVAVIATRGVARRVVGVLVALAGAALVWRALTSAGAVGTDRARSLVTARHRTVDADAVVPRVAVSAAWPTLTIVCGLLVFAAGLLVLVRGHRWRALSARYERPAGEASSGAAVTPQSPTAPALWSALDRGDDPTVDPTTDPTTDPVAAPSDGAGAGPNTDPTGTAQERLDTLEPEQTGRDTTGGRSGGKRPR